MNTERRIANWTCGGNALEGGECTLPKTYAPFMATKTYGHDVGLSCTFRQWRATSHCNKLHGYALAVRFEFKAQTLNDRNWVLDFGGCADLKKHLQAMLDHKTLVAIDDPDLPAFKSMHAGGLLDLVVVPSTGYEVFASMIFADTALWLEKIGEAPRVHIYSVEVREHGGNSATCFG